MEAFAFETLVVPSGNVPVALSSIKYNPAGSHLPVTKALITVNPGPPVSFMLSSLDVVTGSDGHKNTSFGQIDVDGYDNIKNFRASMVLEL